MWHTDTHMYTHTQTHSQTHTQSILDSIRKCLRNFKFETTTLLIFSISCPLCAYKINPGLFTRQQPAASVFKGTPVVPVTPAWTTSTGPFHSQSPSYFEKGEGQSPFFEIIRRTRQIITIIRFVLYAQGWSTACVIFFFFLFFSTPPSSSTPGSLGISLIHFK